jgi:hypothetical protein
VAIYGVIYSKSVVNFYCTERLPHFKYTVLIEKRDKRDCLWNKICRIAIQTVLLLHRVSKCIQTVQNTDEVIKNGHSIETGSIGYTRRRQAKQKHNTTCVGHHSLGFLVVSGLLIGIVFICNVIVCVGVPYCDVSNDFRLKCSVQLYL